jgi:hypothetical protein
LLIMFLMSSACTSFPSKPKIHRFGLLMVSQRSCILHSYFFRVFFFFKPLNLHALTIYLVFKPWYSVFNLIQSTGDTFTCVLHLNYWAFQNFSLIFFSEFLYLYWISFSCLGFSYFPHLSEFLRIHSDVYSCPL